MAKNYVARLIMSFNDSTNVSEVHTLIFVAALSGDRYPLSTKL